MEGQTIALFGHLPNGAPVEELTLRDGACSCQIITYGGAVRTLTVPDRAGRPVDVVLGFDTLEDYLSQDKYIGALVGRYANRIGGSRFSLDGQDFPLAANDAANHLHGGLVGFDKQLWQVEELTDRRAVLSLTSPDGQEGYPGTLKVTVTYSLQDSALSIEYRAVSDKATVCSLTNHSYFNLSGHSSGRVEEQYIQLLPSRYTPCAPGSIPTGQILPVEGTPMDLRTAQPIGRQIGQPFEQLLLAGGYDHNWAADRWDGTLRPIAQAWSPRTGIAMETLTTLPGVQFYTGNFLAGCPLGKGGAPYGDRHAFCLETQYFPDAPNQPAFPSPILRPGQEHRSQTVYRFYIQEQPEAQA